MDLFLQHHDPQPRPPVKVRGAERSPVSHRGGRPAWGQPAGQGTTAPRAFTMVEMLGVIAIIAILAGLLIPAIGIAQTRAKATETGAILGTTEAAIMLFYNVNGQTYPLDANHTELTTQAEWTSTGLANNGPLRAALAGVDQDHFGEAGKHVKGGRIVDGWGKPLRYLHFMQYPASQPNANSFQLWSIGADGIDQHGADDDQANWD